MWTEVNLVLADDGCQAYPCRNFLSALQQVVEPVTAQLDGEVRSWHFGYYQDHPGQSHVRLRLLWPVGEPARFGDLLQDLTGRGRPVRSWFRGAHGVQGARYEGEEAEYGPLWEATYRLWDAQSRWALAVLCHHQAGTLPDGPGDHTTRGAQYHWERMVHLATNRLGLPYVDEVHLALSLASGYLCTIARTQPDVTWQVWARTLAVFADSVDRQLTSWVTLNEIIAEAPPEAPDG